MKVYELTLKVFLLKTIGSTETLQKISELIDKSLSRDKKFLEFHTNSGFKNYTFNSLFPVEKSKIYNEGKIYSIKVRTIDEELAEYFKKNLVNEYTDFIKALTIEYKIIKPGYIDRIYSITPVVIKTEEGYWKGNLSLDEFEKRIKENLIKKYNKYFNTKLDEDFQLFNMINFDNIKPISSKYKSVNILGDKLTLTIAENKTAQDLACLALGAGIGEMGSRGFGFVNYKQL
ncbi:CRISPR associated protein Cas6 [Clostridium homopropionicum DSM 5847]|uniref:CRISPR associated protein Cas6 n=1 Tax=Clostridium homopropionicum DSM 5847 TaxID=1121318 RepID=A0A0L6Z834_9CLOT|nr:CRISPR-associated endoribonuclease Cas6 [Clostridium homopropionicum]KOA19132.1 CRISPR associated protein Cas6 [Clostridium homopropionicum DSM 5847]SFG84584.1 CRISPR-associated endoribonuclease Cas6 [Clostridium homopropionicum]